MLKFKTPPPPSSQAKKFIAYQSCTKSNMKTNAVNNKLNDKKVKIKIVWE